VRCSSGHKLTRDLGELYPEGALDQLRVGMEEVAAAHAAILYDPMWPGKRRVLLVVSQFEIAAIELARPLI
jgi:hypothetical protein